MIDLKEKAPQHAELIDSLRTLEISDEDIAKSLNIDISEKTEPAKTEKIEKSIEEQIAEKKNELLKLEEIQKSNKPVDYKEKFDEIQKSFSERLEENSDMLTERFDKMVNLVKSLTDEVITLKEGNAKISKDNEELKKSLDKSAEVLEKLASFTPGLKSIKNVRFVDRFEKSEDGKEILSISQDKNKISSMLSSKLDDEKFRKSFGPDVDSFECSGRVSEKLSKAIADELGVKLVG